MPRKSQRIDAACRWPQDEGQRRTTRIQLRLPMRSLHGGSNICCRRTAFCWTVSLVQATMLLAGLDLGASKVIGIDKQKKYLKIAEKRLCD